MKKSSIVFLKAVICLMGIAVLAWLLWFPQIEGRNANSDWLSLYFNDPFLAYIYVGAIPFFVALYQTLKLLKSIEQNKAFSQASVEALRNIKYCAMTIIGFLLGALAFVILSHGDDDAAGFISIGVITTFSTLVIAVFAAVLQKLFQNALDIKSENELTV